jgi:type IV secretion system protein VirB9
VQEPAGSGITAQSGIRRAIAAARVEPEHAAWNNAIQQFAWAEGALYQVYCAPGQITDLALEPGEELVGPGPVAAGDTVRWIIGDTASGEGATRRVHLLVKPARPGISTNLVINTDRRTYHLELHATAGIYMAGVSWTYPAGQLIALGARSGDRRGIAVAGGTDLAQLNFAYRISGDRTNWRPARVFDDGRQVFVEFGAEISRTDMPPLFVIGADKRVELVNYRVSGRYLIVDRLFERAELRLGAGSHARRVRIERQSGGDRR